MSGPRHNTIPTSPRLDAVRILVYASNALLLTVAIWDGWRVTHLLWPFAFEWLLFIVFALLRVLVVTFRRLAGRIEGDSPLRAVWAGTKAVLFIVMYSVVALYVLFMILLLVAVAQPIEIPRPSIQGNLPAVFGVASVMLMLVQRHWLRFRRRTVKDRATPTDLEPAVWDFRIDLSTMAGVGLLMAAGIMGTSGLHRLVDIVVMAIVILVKAMYELRLATKEAQATTDGAADRQPGRNEREPSLP